MARLLTDIPALFFPAAADCVELAAEDAAETSCSLRIGVGAETVLDTVLWFDAAGRVKVEDLAPLLYERVRGTELRAVRVELEISTASGGTYVRGGLMLPCRVGPSLPADEFCRRMSSAGAVSCRSARPSRPRRPTRSTSRCTTLRATP